jgi:ketosteroid isomerase-like protein
MPPGNVELVKRVGDAVNRRDADALGELFHPEFEFHSAIAGVEGDIFRGVGGMRRYFAEVDATWENFRIDLQEVREAGEQLFVSWRARGTSLSGVPLDEVTAQVWTWRDGMPWRNQSFTDVAEALEVAGLSD